jgi:exodeoxyribonuclease VII large subunit
LTTLGPAATLARGYAVVQRVPDGVEPGTVLPVLRSVTEVEPGTRLRIRVADGAVAAAVADEGGPHGTDGGAGNSADTGNGNGNGNGAVEGGTTKPAPTRPRKKKASTT